MGAFDDLIPQSSGDNPFADLQPGAMLRGEKPVDGGFFAAAKQSGGSLLKGAGQFAADFIPGVSDDNAVKRYGQEVIDANPTAVQSLSDIADKPLTAIKEATGNAAGSMAGIVGSRLVGQGITAAAPLTGPAAPVVAAVGQGISLLGPYAVAALPSFGSIREKQQRDTPQDKAIAALGAGTVGLIENKFGPQEWALSAMTKAGRDQLAEKFAAKTLTGSIAKGIGTGAAVEGGEELVQNPIEQLASYQDPRTPENLADTAFGGVMGAIGGGVVGGPMAGLAHRQPQPVAVPRQDGQGEALIDPATGPISAAAADHVQRNQTTDDLFGDLTPATPVASAIEPLVNVPETGDPFADLVPASPLQDFAAQVEPVSLDEAQALAAQADGAQIVAPHPSGDGYILGPREWFQSEQIDVALQPGNQQVSIERPQATDPLAGRIQAVLDAYDTAGHPDNGKIIRAAMKSRAPTEQTVAFWEAQLNRNLRTWQSIAGQGQPVEAKLRTADDLWQGDREQATRTFVPDDITAAVLARSNALVQQLAERGVHLDEVDSRFPADVSDTKKAESGLRGLFLRYAKQLEAKAKGYKRFDAEALAKTEAELFQAIGYQPTIDQAAGTANTAPSEAQIAAGNYQKGHVKVGTLDIAIENPVGSTRTGPGWQTTMQAHYGYLKRTKGADGDQVDVYVKAGTPDDHTGPVYVVDQYDLKTGKFDEHKSFVGYGSKDEAVAAYDQHFSDGSGPQRRRGVVEMSPEAFKTWATNGDTKKPAYTAIEGDRPHALPETIRTALHRDGKTTRRPLGADGRSRSILAVRQAPEVPGLYRVSTQLVTVGERRLPLDRVANWDDAARTFSHLHRYAVEHLDALVTDAEGSPLATIGGFKGGTTYSSVSPGAVMMELARIEGAAGLWLAHNHPSGLAELSQADHNLSKTFADILQDSGITYHGLAAITRNGETVAWKNTDDATGTVPRLQKAPHRLPLVEREIVESEPGETVTSPAKAKALVAELAKDQTGVVFLTAQNQVASFVPFDTAEMSELRQGDRLMRLFRAASQSGAVSAFVAIPDNKVTNAQFANLKGALGSIEIRVLDGIKYDSQTGQAGRSLAEEGKDTSAGLSFKAPSGIEPSSIDAEVFGLVSARRPIDKVLAHIAAHSSKPINRALAQALQRKGLQTQVMAAEQPTPGTGGIYDGKSNTIELHTASGAEQLFLHEAVHAATVQAIGQNGIAARQLRRLLWQVRDQLGQDAHYGLKNVPEFIAEAMTNRQFQDALREIPVANSRLDKLTNAWREFVSILRGLLGLEKGQETALSRAIELGARLLEANDDTKAGDGQYFSRTNDDRLTVRDWLTHQLANQRSWALGALTRDQLADIYGREMPEVAEFDRVVQQMDQARNIVAEQADALIERWRKLPSKMADALADVMHLATLEQFDPDTKTREEVQTPEQSILVKEWGNLSPEAQQIYRDVRDQYQATLVKLRNGLAKRADTQTAAAIRLEFDKYLAEGPYFPLARFGDFILIANNRIGERIVEAFESSAAREKRARGLRAQGWTTKLTAKKAYSAASDGPSGEFVGKVLGLVGGLDIEAKEKAALMDSLNQLAIGALPDQSYRKHFSHRKGTPGFSQDAMRAFASSMQHVAHHVARVLHGDELQILVDGLNKRTRETTGDVDTTAMQQVANELSKRLDLMLNPTTHPVTAALGQVGFVMSLGGSVASGITNLSQTPLVTFPWLGSRFGFTKAAAALTAASKDYFAGRWDKWSGFVMRDSTNLSADERRALTELEDAGLINLTQAHDLAGTANTDSASSRRSFAINRAMKLVGWTFHVPEVMNRQVSALAAYRLAREKGQDHTGAVETARETLRRTHFDYSASNRARWMAGNFTRVITMFKQYSQNVTYLLWRQTYQALKGETPEVRQEARRMLLGVAATHFAAAGALGLPLGVFGVTPLLGLLAMGMGSEDEPWDWQVEFRNLLADLFGKQTGEAIAHGPLRTLTGIDMAGRVGLGDLWVRAPQAEKEGRDLVEAWMLTLLGPVAGYAGNIGTAMKAFDEGKVGRGLEAMLPKFIAAPIKASRYEAEGVKSWRGDDLGIKLDGGDIFATVLGFQPAQLAEMFEGQRAIKGREAKLMARREEISNMFTSAALVGDQETQTEAIKAAQAFSLRNPSMALTADSLRRSLQAKVRNQALIQDGVYLSKRRQDLRAEGRFANFE